MEAKAGEFRPFRDAESAWTVRGLSVENGPGEVFVHGAASFGRDRASADAARRLAALFAAIADAAEEQVSGEDRLPDVLPDRVANPFARKPADGG